MALNFPIRQQITTTIAQSAEIADAGSGTAAATGLDLLKFPESVTKSIDHTVGVDVAGRIELFRLVKVRRQRDKVIKIDRAACVQITLDQIQCFERCGNLSFIRNK